MKLSTAICFPGAIKYRNIPINRIDKFKEFIKIKFPLVEYLNLYDKETKKYLKRIYL